MILRIWHGWTTPESTDAYERLLLGEVIPGIEVRAVPGFLGITAGRRRLGAEVEFVTLMRLADRESVRAFAGDDPEAAYVPPAARTVLARWEEHASHYEIADDRPAADR